MYNSLSEREEYLARQIVDIAIKVHKQLGPGLLESVYAKCFCHELLKRGISYSKEVQVPIYFDDLKLMMV